MKKPNFLIIYTDQQRWDALGVNGNADIQTPCIDQLAADGVNFDHCFVQNQLCMPSRVSFFTGVYPSALRITHMGVPVPKETLTLPKVLSSYGYHCANIGKLHFLPHANRDHRELHPDYGFNQLEVADEPGPYEDAYRAWVAQRRPDQLDLISCGIPPHAATWYKTLGIKDPVTHPIPEGPVPATYTHTEGGSRFAFMSGVPFPAEESLSFSSFVAEQTMAYLDNQDGKTPFCCVAGFYSPHAPWIVPQRFLDLYDADALQLPDYPASMNQKRPVAGGETDLFSDAQLRNARKGYYAAVSEVDHHVGRIIAHLEKTGLADNTVVIFTSDHGEWLGDQMLYGKSYPAHDPITRVPLIVKAPGLIAGARDSHLIEALDVMPTLLDLAGIQVPPTVQGRSFATLLGAPSAKPYAPRTSALTEYTGWRMVRTERYRYIAHVDGKECLFDLQQPHGDYTNVAADPVQGAALAGLRAEMVRRLIATENPLPRAWTY